MTDTLTIPAPYELRPSTITAARRHVTQRALRESWTDTDLDDLLAMLGLDQPATAPAPAPAPTTAPPAPTRAPIDPWFDTADLMDESGLGRHHVDSWVRSGYLTPAATRQSGGVIVPCTPGRSRGARLYTRGDVAIACRMSHLNARWRQTGALNLGLADYAAIARIGHAADLDPVLAWSVDWRRIAIAAEAAVDERVDCLIWREALTDLAVRAAAIAVELGGARADIAPERS